MGDVRNRHLVVARRERYPESAVAVGIRLPPLAETLPKAALGLYGNPLERFARGAGYSTGDHSLGVEPQFDRSIQVLRIDSLSKVQHHPGLGSGAVVETWFRDSNRCTPLRYGDLGKLKLALAIGQQGLRSVLYQGSGNRLSGRRVDHAAGDRRGVSLRGGRSRPKLGLQRHGKVQDQAAKQHGDGADGRAGRKTGFGHAARTEGVTLWDR